MNNWKSLLREHIEHHPELEAQDVLKFIHQSFMGPGHLIADPQAALARLEDEWSQVVPDQSTPLYDSIGNGLCRLNISHCKAISLSAKTIAFLFTETANQFTSDPAALKDALSCVRNALIPPLTQEALDTYFASGCPAVSHSSRYRSAYAPAYRVILDRYVQYLPLLADIDRSVAAGIPVRIALDGPCASGKSTLGHWLSELYSCPLIHMDDFFLLPHMRTPDRLAQPGGNVDYERFDREVLTPLSNGSSAHYQPFRCSTGTFGPECIIPFSPVAVIEGSYSLRPDLRERYTHRVWVEADWPARRQRILARGGNDVLSRYEQQWIPLENHYFDSCHVKHCCNYRLSGNK